MSTVSGSISVNVEFRDSTTSSGVQSLKTIALRDTTEYTTGKVAIITGTAGTAAVNLGDFGETSYRNALGNLVDFQGSVQRLAFSWRGASAGDVRDLVESDSSAFRLRSKNGEPSVTTNNGIPGLLLDAGTGTGTYTIVLYGT